MRIKYPFLTEEAGAEPATTEGGSEETEFNFDEWMSDDADPDGEEVEEETTETETEEEVEEKEEVDVEEEETPEPEKEEKPEEKWTLKIEGEDVEYDPSDVEQTKAWIQKGMSAQKTWQEAGKIRNQANQFMESFKQNPKAILENPALGLDPVALAEEILYEKIEEENMSPSEKAMRKELKELRAKEHQKEIEAQQADTKARKEKQEQNLRDIQSNLEAAGLPVTQDNVNKTVQYMRQAINAGLTNVTPQSVLEYVQKDHVAQQKQYISSLKVDQLIELLGKDTVDQIRQHNVKQAIESKKKVKPKAQPTKKAKKDPDYVGDLSDWLNR